MNDSFPTTVSGVARDHFQLWFRQPVEAQDASRVPSRERPKDPCGSVQRGRNHRVGSHQVPRDPLSNSGLTEELDEPIGTAAAYAVRNVPVARPEERCRGGVGRDARIHLRHRHRGGRVYERAPRRSRPNRAAPWRRRRTPYLADVMNIDAPVVAPGTHQERAARLASKRAEPEVARSPAYP